MLGKLIKHEFKTTSKMILPLYLIIVVLTVFARITMQNMLANDNSFGDSVGMEIFSVLSIMAYILGLFAICVATFIYIIMRFYKNLFSNEGYLMHTLPVNSWQLLSSKVIVSFVWQLLEVLLIGFSIFCILACQESFDAVSNFLNAYGGFDAFIYYATGMSVGGFWCYVIFFGILSILSGILMPYVSICIGQLWQKHKLAGAFLAYFVIMFVMQIISGIYTSFVTTDASSMETASFVFSFSLYNFSAILSLISVVVFFFLSGYIMKKKINLD